jgi:alpha-1,2-mannosyltransferase
MRVTATARAWIALAAIGLLALAARLVPAVLSGSVGNRSEYDGGVMLGGAMRLWAGALPYHDFVFVHPPGSLLLYLPAAAVAPAIGEPTAFGALVVATGLVGTANAILIGVLLRPRGVTAVVIGAGLYAVWPVVVLTDRLVLLEPILSLCLLAALLAMRTRPSGGLAGTWVAGALLGLALTVKLWAVVDVVLLGAMILIRSGRRGLWRYVAAGTATAAAVVSPFFFAAPQEMWEQTVIAQLTRPAAEAGLASRINLLSPFHTVPAIDALAPWWLWGALGAAALVAATLPLARALRRRRRPSAWDDAVWWGLIAIVHTVVILAAASFYDHYLAWAVAPLALSVGNAASWITAPRARRVVAAVGGFAIVAIAVPLFAGRPAPDLQPMRSWAATSGCVWGEPAALIAADTLLHSVAAGCSSSVDPFGEGLAALAGSGGDPDAAATTTDSTLRRQLEQADAAILDSDETAWAFGGRTAVWFQESFTRVHTAGGLSAWERRGTGDHGGDRDGDG